MEKIYGRTKTIQEDKVSGFCPGCMHSTVIKLIGEVLEEMELVDRAACVLGIGCCGLHMDYIAYDNTTAPHGRTVWSSPTRATATSPPSAWPSPFPPPTAGRTSPSSSSTTASTA